MQLQAFVFGMASPFAVGTRGTIFSLLLLAFVLPTWIVGRILNCLRITSLVRDKGQSIRVESHMLKSTLFSNYYNNSVIKSFYEFHYCIVDFEGLQILVVGLQENGRLCLVKHTPIKCVILWRSVEVKLIVN